MKILTLRQKLDNLKSSKVIRLNWDGKTVGLRVMLYSLTTDTFSYYDFATDYVSSLDIRQFLKSGDFPVEQLVAHNNLLVTEDERQGKVSPQEFKNQEQAEAILRQIMNVCAYKTLTSSNKAEQEELDDEELEAQREWDNPAYNLDDVPYSSGYSSYFN